MNLSVINMFAETNSPAPHVEVLVCLVVILVITVGFLFRLLRRLREKEAELRRQLEEKQASQAAIIKSQELFTKIFHSSPDCMVIFHSDSGRVQNVNESFCRTLGFSHLEVIGKEADQWNIWAVPAERGEFLRILEDKGEVLNLDSQFLTKDGQAIPMLVSGRSIDIDGEASCLVLAKDISERRRAQAELGAVEDRLTATLCSIREGIIALDEQGLVTLINPEAEALTGWTADEARGLAFNELNRYLDPKTQDSLEDVGNWPAASNRDGDEGWHRAILIDRQGQERQILSSWAKIHDSQGKALGAVTVFRDITDFLAMELRLRKAQRMEAVGHLAGGVAHDFNNILGAIMGNAELLKIGVSDPKATSRFLGNIIDGCQRGSSLTQQLQAYTRRGKLQTVAVNIHEMIPETIAALRLPADSPIKVIENLNSQEPCINGDPHQVSKTLLNLAKNAREAMPDGGELHFSTRAVQVDRDFCREWKVDLRAGDYMELVVADTGVGMDKNTLSQLFDPFYSTKETRKGLGLGMAAVFGMVKSHQGDILVTSTTGKGSVFRIFLPLATEDARRALSPKWTERVTGTGHILLVDDEAELRVIASAMLRNLGYTVTACEDGAAAIQIFMEAEVPFDLVILDMVMPKLSGKDTFMHLHALQDDVRVLLCTGYSLGKDVQDVLDGGALGVIQKPFRELDLSNYVAQALKA